MISNNNNNNNRHLLDVKYIADSKPKEPQRTGSTTTWFIDLVSDPSNPPISIINHIDLDLDIYIFGNTSKFNFNKDEMKPPSYYNIQLQLKSKEIISVTPLSDDIEIIVVSNQSTSNPVILFKRERNIQTNTSFNIIEKHRNDTNRQEFNSIDLFNQYLNNRFGQYTIVDSNDVIFKNIINKQ